MQCLPAIPGVPHPSRKIKTPAADWEPCRSLGIVGREGRVVVNSELSDACS